MRFRPTTGWCAMTEPEVGELRRRVQDLANAGDWAAALALAPRLRADTAYWIDVWAPLLAIAARHVGDPAARGYLAEAIAGGFHQPENFEGEVERGFAGDPDWPALAAAIAANVPPARLALLSWPELTPALPVRLDEIGADRRDALRARLPEPDGSAWSTARRLLHWVSTAWQHSGSSHVTWSDAVHVLDRVAAGERFACREYTIVLSQALNAAGIPARGVRLLRPNYYTGLGGRHDVAEAWLDDVGAWAVLDGQNGMYWADADGTPLGVPELTRRYAAGEPRPEPVDLAGKAADPDAWWPYFHRTSPTGLALAAPPYSPLLEGTRVNTAEQLRADQVGSHPDLLELGVGIAEVDGRPALQPVTRHPYATGFEIRHGAATTRLKLAGDPWPLPDATPGDHLVEIATRTQYGTHGRHAVRVRVTG